MIIRLLKKYKIMQGIINEENIENGDVVILLAPYEKTASSHKGTVNGPKEIVKCLNTQIEFFNRKYKKNTIDFLRVANRNILNLENLNPSEAKYLVKKNCEELINASKFIFLLGGEHSVSLGHLEALKEKYNPDDVTILQIDAHCDLRNDDSDYNPDSPSPFAHSTVMRRASELGYHIVQVGIRTYSEDEFNYFSDKKNNITVFEWGDESKTPSIGKILRSIKTKYLYITIDVDGFDPSFMPGTGTPVQGGLDWWYGVELIENAIEKYELIGADIVEVSPISDSVLTEYGSAELCYRIITEKFKKKFPE